nr:hypothetical protein [Candidatus Sigynarchaeota archaeon]
MDEPKKAPSNETDTRAEKPIAVLATADKGQTVVNYITRVQPASPETKQALGAPVQELVVVKNLAKILKFYSTMIKQGETSANKNLLYSGNVIVNKNFQDIEFITKLLEVDEAGKEFSMFVIDIERILIDFKEFSIIMDDFFDYVKINIPSIIFLYNSDAFLSKAYKARETSAFTTFSINFSRFFVERNVRNDKIV